MGKVANWQLEPRNVRWPWCGRHQVVVLTRWHWTIFDNLAAKRQITADALHRAIWQTEPGASHIGVAIARYIEDQASLAGDALFGMANVDTYWATGNRGVPDRPMSHPRPLPTIKWSPFKPISRPTRVFA